MDKSKKVEQFANSKDITVYSGSIKRKFGKQKSNLTEKLDSKTRLALTASVIIFSAIRKKLAIKKPTRTTITPETKKEFLKNRKNETSR